MENELQRLAADYKKCKRDWAKTNTIKDPERQKRERARLTSLRNAVRGQLRWEILRVEGALGRVSRM